LSHDSYFVQKVLTLSAIMAHRRPKTKCQLNFCDDVHVASFKKFHKEPIDGKIQ